MSPSPGATIDGQNRRVGKLLGGNPVNGWLYDGPHVVAELDASGAALSRFHYGAKGHSPESIVEAGVTYRVFSDQLGSPRLVVNASTGAIVRRRDYDPSGNVTTDTSPGFQPFGFAGGIYDTATNLTRFGVRDYEPNCGRWINKDPARLLGGLNFYVYVANDPVNQIDPEGLWDPVGYVPAYDGFAALGRALAIFWKRYTDMRQTWWRDSDKYFHCMANCEATHAGAEDAAYLISEARELTDQYIKGDSRLVCDEDRAAKKRGRDGRDQECRAVCQPLRPRGLPEQY